MVVTVKPYDRLILPVQAKVARSCEERGRAGCSWSSVAQHPGRRSTGGGRFLRVGFGAHHFGAQFRRGPS